MLAQWAGIVASKPIFNAAKQHFCSNSEGAEHFRYCYVLLILLLGKAALGRKGNGNTRGFGLAMFVLAKQKGTSLRKPLAMSGKRRNIKCKEYSSTIQERAGIVSKHKESPVPS